MPVLPEITLILTIVFAIMWVVGESIDKPWLRRIAVPLFVVAFACILVFATAIRTSFQDSIRYSGAMKRFVSSLLETSDREGDSAAVEQLRRFDAASVEAYEGGALPQWLAEPTDSHGESNEGGQQFGD